MVAAEPSAEGQDVLRATILLTNCSGHTSDMPCDDSTEGWVALGYSSGSRTSRAKSSVSVHLVMVEKVWPAAPEEVEVNGALEMRLMRYVRCLLRISEDEQHKREVGRRV